MTNLSPTRGRPFWTPTKFISREGRDRDAYYEENGPPQPLETLFSPSEFLLFKIVSHCYHQFVHCIEKRAEAITFYQLLTLSHKLFCWACVSSWVLKKDLSIFVSLALFCHFILRHTVKENYSKTWSLVLNCKFKRQLGDLPTWCLYLRTVSYTWLPMYYWWNQPFQELSL